MIQSRSDFVKKAAAATGLVAVGSLFSTAKAWAGTLFQSTGPNDVPVVVKADPDQSANLTEWKLSSGQKKTRVANDGSIYYSETNSFPDRDAGVTVLTTMSSPPASGRRPSLHVVGQGKGDNTTAKGVTSVFVRATDTSDVDESNKGMLYAIEAQVAPRVTRDNVPVDDANGIVVVNDPAFGANRATDAIYVGHANAFGTNPEWKTGVTLDCNAWHGLRINGAYTSTAIDLSAATIATNEAIKLGAGHKFKLVTPPVVSGAKQGEVEQTLVAALSALGLISDQST
jgi:hypothetical protein